MKFLTLPLRKENTFSFTFPNILMINIRNYAIYIENIQNNGQIYIYIYTHTHTHTQNVYSTSMTKHRPSLSLSLSPLSLSLSLYDWSYRYYNPNSIFHFISLCNCHITAFIYLYSCCKYNPNSGNVGTLFKFEENEN